MSMYKKFLIAPLFLAAVLILVGIFTNQVFAGSATLNWNANTEPDLAGYRIYYGTSPRTGTCPPGGYANNLSVGLTTSHIFNSLTDGQTWYFSVAAYDTSNNTSCFSAEVSKVLPPAGDTTAPTTPTNLSATAFSSSQINLSWAASTDNVSVAGYRIYRGGVQIATTILTSYSDTGLSPSAAYSYAVAAYDAAGNISSQSVSASATTIAAQSSSLSVSLSANPSSGAGSLSNVTLTASVAGSQTGNINYTFYCNRSDVGTNITTPYDGKYNNQTLAIYTATNLCSYSTPGTYTAKVIAERGMLQSQNTASIVVSSPVSVQTPPPTGGGGGGGGGGGVSIDTTPPAVPSNAKISRSGNQVVITWSNPTDSDFKGIVIARKENSSPASRTDGSIVYNNNLQNLVDSIDSTKTFYYAVYSYDNNNNYSQPVILKTEPGQTSVVSQPAPTTPQTSQPSTSGSAAVSITIPSTAPSSFTFTSYLTVGKSGNEVRQLQEILTANPTIYPEGTVTGYYGPATQRAVQRFQEMNGIAGPSTTGYGDVGPLTRSKLNYYLSYRGTYSPSTYSTSTKPLSKTELIAQLKALIAQIEAKIIVLLKQLQALKSGQ